MLVLLCKLNLGVRKRNDRKLHPGPRPWPIVGNLGQLGPLAHQIFAKLAKQYGPIVYLRLGAVHAIVISSPRLAEEILKTQDSVFASRPHLTQGEVMLYNSQDVALAPYGPYWRHARKVFTLELLTNKRVQQFQSLRKTEAMFTLYSILEECSAGNPVHMNLKFQQMIMNNSLQMMINKSFFGPNATTTNLKEATVVIELIHEFSRLLGVSPIGNYIPLLRNFDLQGYKKQMQAVRGGLDNVLDKIIDEHREKLGSKTSEKLSDSDKKDFVDVLLTRRVTGADDKLLTDEQVKAILLDVIVAGIDTTSTMMEWILTELMRHPAALQKVQDELDTVVGQTRLVEETDIPSLKYFSAVVKESFRLHPVVSLLVPHYSMEASEVAGYHIPANTQVHINVWAIGRDPAIWERPLQFEPERFLTNGINLIGQDFELVPFGSGRRSCPGRNLALLLVEYTLALLLQACNWTLPPGVGPKDVDIGEAPGMSAAKAVPLEAVASPRLPLEIIHANKQRTP